MSKQRGKVASASAAVCERCSAASGARQKRRRCETCRKLVCATCWYPRLAECLGCYGEPTDPTEHLARIEQRYDAMRQAFEAYESVCLGVWDGDADATREVKIAPIQAFNDWAAAVSEAATALGLHLTTPLEPFQAFPFAPEEGKALEEWRGSYDIQPLRRLVNPRMRVTKILVHRGGKK